MNDLTPVPPMIDELAEGLGATVLEVGMHPGGGSGFAMLSFPLPENHWLYQKVGYAGGPVEFAPPAPWPMLVGGHTLTREYMCDVLTPGLRAGVKDATMNGADTAPDPDVLVRQSLNNLFGNNTIDGRSTHAEDRELFDTPTPGSLTDVLIKALSLAIHEGLVSPEHVRAALQPGMVLTVAEQHIAERREQSRQNKRRIFLEGTIGWEGMESDPDIADLWAARETLAPGRWQ